jgi:hypothetical protein
MSARAKSPPGKAAKGKAEASPEEVAAAEAARLTARADGLEADKAREAADRNYAQLERVRPSRTRRGAGASAGSAQCTLHRRFMRHSNDFRFGRV